MSRTVPAENGITSPSPAMPQSSRQSVADPDRTAAGAPHPHRVARGDAGCRSGQIHTAQLQPG